MELFNWTFLATFAGCAAATAAVVQLIKAHIPWPTQLVSYFVALGIFLAATLAIGGWTWQDLALTPLNAALVALAANGGYAAVKRASSNDVDEIDAESGDTDG